MKKILILAYDFPPYISVGGLRPKSWFDNLIDFNLQPYLITRNWSQNSESDFEYIAFKNKKTLIKKLKTELSSKHHISQIWQIKFY